MQNLDCIVVCLHGFLVLLSSRRDFLPRWVLWMNTDVWHFLQFTQTLLNENHLRQQRRNDCRLVLVYIFKYRLQFFKPCHKLATYVFVMDILSLNHACKGLIVNLCCYGHFFGKLGRTRCVRRHHLIKCRLRPAPPLAIRF